MNIVKYVHVIKDTEERDLYSFKRPRKYPFMLDEVDIWIL